LFVAPLSMIRQGYRRYGCVTKCIIIIYLDCLRPIPRTPGCTWKGNALV